MNGFRSFVKIFLAIKEPGAREVKQKTELVFAVFQVIVKLTDKLTLLKILMQQTAFLFHTP